MSRLSRNRNAFYLQGVEPTCVALRPADWRVRFYQAANQRSEEIQLGRRNQIEHAEAAAVRRANESEAFPSHHRAPGT